MLFIWIVILLITRRISKGGIFTLENRLSKDARRCIFHPTDVFAIFKSKTCPPAVWRSQIALTDFLDNYMFTTGIRIINLVPFPSSLSNSIRPLCFFMIS